MTEQPKNIIIVCDYGFVNGGAARIAIQTALLLSEKNYNVTYFCGVGPIDDSLKNSNVRTVCLFQNDVLGTKNKIAAFFENINNKKAKKCFAELLSEFDSSNTIIHFHSWIKCLSSSVIEVATLLKFQICFTVHDYFLVCPNGGCFNYKKTNICSFMPLGLKCCCSNCDSRNYLFKFFRLLRQKHQNKIISKIKNNNLIFISDFSKTEFEKRVSKKCTFRFFYCRTKGSL